MNSDVWRTPQGQIGTEIARQQTSRGDIVRLAINGGEGFPVTSWHPAHALKPEKPRYEGARGGRVSG